jgi:3-carboxy-cis,cis-muconate cycloisomerase
MSYVLERSDLLSPIAGDDEVAQHLSSKADIDAILKFEVALAHACAQSGIIPMAAVGVIAEAAKHIRPDTRRLAAGMARDGVVVPELIRQLRAAVKRDHADAVHFGATSQDAIDTSMVLRMRAICELLSQRCKALIVRIKELEKQFGAYRIEARTRMQIARPIRARERLARWRRTLDELAKTPDREKLRWYALQFGGPTGTLDDYGSRGVAVANELAKRLNLSSPAENWQTDRGRVVAVAAWLSQLTGALGKIGADICLMAQNEIAEVALADADAGGSSSMAHKRNPVKAEILVALARHSATLLGAMHQALVHEQERSGAAWTLEWLTLPQMCMNAGAATRIAGELFASIERFGKKPDKEK